MRKSAGIRQMPLKPFFTPRGSFLRFFSADLALSQEWPKQIIFFANNILQNITFD
jgi:hypothetical protein